MVTDEAVTLLSSPIVTLAVQVDVLDELDELRVGGIDRQSDERRIPDLQTSPCSSGRSFRITSDST